MGWLDDLNALDKKYNPYRRMSDAAEDVGKAIGSTARRHLEGIFSKDEKKKSDVPPAPEAPRDAFVRPSGDAPPTLVAASKPVVNPEPIVTPTPRLFLQYDAGPIAGVQAKSVPIRTPMRPPYDPAGTNTKAFPWMQQDGAPGAPIPGGDMWQGSACHPTVLAMIAQWLMMNPRTREGLSITTRSGLPDEKEQTPLHWAKYLWDPSGNPNTSRYTSEDHPPWIPRVAQGGEWYVAHSTLSSMFCAKLLREAGGSGSKLEMITARFMPRNAGDRASERVKELANLVYRHGPLALNIAIPAHFVLLYGVRGNFLYILDPGREIVRLWGMPHADKTPADTPGDFDVSAPAGSEEKFVFRSLPNFHGNNVIIDALHPFPKVKKQSTPRRFIDTLILAEAYSFSDCRVFSDFLMATAPDGRTSSDGKDS